MNRIATTFAIILLSAGAAAAQGLVTRAEPAELFVSPSDLALLPATTVTVTSGAQVEVPAADVLTARDRALTGLDAGDTVAVTMFQGTNSTVSVR